MPFEAGTATVSEDLAVYEAAGKGVDNGMKAHVRKASQQPKETALLFCIKEEKQNEIRRILEYFGAKVISAGAEDAGQTLGALLGMDGFPLCDKEEPKEWEEAIVFSGFDRSRLDSVLSRMKSAGTTVAYKAVLTANNQGWTMAHLMGELSVEHTVFSKLGQIRALARQILQRDPSKLSEQDRRDAGDALSRANSILKNPAASSLDEMELVTASMQRTLAMLMAADITAPKDVRQTETLPEQNSVEKTE